LHDLGHDIIPFRYNVTPHFKNLDFTVPRQDRFIKNHRAKLESVLLTQIETAHKQRKIDLFLSYFYSAICRPEVIQEIRRLGIVTVNWFCNASYQFHLVEALAPAYDYCLVPEKSRMDDYRKSGANPIYFQEGANPNIYKPYAVEKDIQVSFAGQNYGDRASFINFIARNNIEVNVYGAGWKGNSLRSILRRVIKGKARTHLQTGLTNIIINAALSDDGYIRMYSRSKISLGFSSCGETHLGNRILQIRLRDFEGPMCGAFYMTEYQQELEDFFDIGKEIICYSNKEDLVDKIKFYIKHEAERTKIAEAGHQRAQKDHSWQKRFESFFRQISLI
jgi:spore maturation protein CgeB